MKDNFASIITEFSPKFKHLGRVAYDLRNALFFPPHAGGSFFTGTKDDKEEMENLYSRMTNIFKAALCPV